MHTGPMRRSAAVLVAGALAVAGALVLGQNHANAADTAIISTADTTWRYFEAGDPVAGNADPDAWAAPAFDDGAWKSAKGSFGAKDGTKLALTGGYTANTLLTQYKEAKVDREAFFFRAKANLTADQLTPATKATATMVYDDGASLFVNGTYVGGGDDAALQADAARNTTYGGSNDDVPKTVAVDVPLNLLRAGENTVAVRLHNGRASSSDIYLDVNLKLVATDASPSPTATTTAPATSTVSRVLLGVGADETQRALTWYSSVAEGQVAQLVKAAQLVDGAFPATGTTVVQPTRSGASAVAGQTFNQTMLTGLEPGEYAYRVGSETGWSATHKFTVAPKGAYEFILVGDPQLAMAGNVAGWTNTMATAREMFPAAQLLVSAGDQVDTASNETMYDYFLTPDQLRAMALSPTIGNHDTNAANYDQHFNIVNKDKNTRDNWFTWNGDLYLVIDTNNPNVADHKAFLQAAIAANPDAGKRIVVMHHSLYSTASHTNDNDIKRRRTEFPQLFTEFGVDFIMSGHDHVYTRTHLMNGEGQPVTSGQPEELNPKQGEWLYLTANSSSGSKYYNIVNQEFPFMSVMNQEKTPNFTHVAMGECEARFTTYRSVARTPVDQVTLNITRAKPVIEAADATVATTAVGSFDPMRDVKVTDPCEPGLKAELVSGKVGAAPGEYALTYKVTDAYGNVVTKVRNVTVATAPPTGVVLGVGSDETQRSLTWYSSTNERQSAQLVKADELVDGAFPAKPRVFEPTRQVPSNIAGKFSNQTALTGLERGVTYAYRVGSEAEGWSPVTRFTVAPAGTYEYIFVGDPQIGSGGNVPKATEGWSNTMSIAKEMYPGAQLLVSAGDQVNTATSEAEYTGFLTPSQLREMALSPTIGNHDVGSQPIYEQHFRIVNKDATNRDNWFTWNGDLYMVINTNNGVVADHKAFMQSAIAANPDAGKRIVVMHHSLYSTASHANDDDIIRRRGEFPPLFSELGIDYAMAGHDHVYVRTHVMNGAGEPVSSGQPSEVAPKAGEWMYLTANSASGSKFYGIRNQDFPFMSVMNQEQVPNFTRVLSSECETKFTTHRSGDRSVVDEFTIKSNKAKPVIKAADVTLAAADVAGWDETAGVLVTDPCEPGLKADVVSGEVKSEAGTYELTYKTVDAYGNEVSLVRAVTVQAAPAPTPTVTVTATAPAPTVTETVPGPTVTETVPGATVTESVQVPGATVTVTAQPTTSPTQPSAPAPIKLAAPYEVPGYHTINGRKWFTTCEAYSQTQRCRTDIWATQVSQVGGKFVQKTGWYFNNLTYLPFMTRAQWAANPLANTGTWQAADGRQWRTECDTPATGKGACRSYAMSSFIKATERADGTWSYAWTKDWVFNNLVRFRQG